MDAGQRCVIVMQVQSLYKSIASVAGSAAIAQLLVAISAPIITRLFTVADLGAFAAYQSFVLIFTLLFTLRYEFSIPVVKRGKHVKPMGVLILLVVVAAFLLSTALVGFIAYLNKDLNPIVKDVLIYLPVGMAVFGIHEAIKFIIIRKRDYYTLAKSNMWRGVIQIVAQALGGLFVASLWVLILSHVLSLVVAIVLMLKKYRNSFVREMKCIKNNEYIKKVRNLAMSYSRFPRQFMPFGIVNLSGQQAPPILFAIVFTSEVVGYFAISQRLLGLPMALIGKAVGDVYYGEFSEIIRNDDKGAKELFLGVLKRLALLALPVALVPMLLPASFYEYVLGKGWGEIRHTIGALGVAYAFQIMATPLAQTMVVLEKQRILFAWDILRLVIVSAICLSPLITSMPYAAVVNIYSACVSILYLILIIAMWLCVRERFAD